MLDLVLRNARIAGRGDAIFDIGIARGRIAEIAQAISSDAPLEDAGGRLVMPGFVETHIHLDKSCILDRCESRDGTLQEAIAQVAAAKRGFTEDEVLAPSSASSATTPGRSIWRSACFRRKACSTIPAPRNCWSRRARPAPT